MKTRTGSRWAVLLTGEIEAVAPVWHRGRTLYATMMYELMSRLNWRPEPSEMRSVCSNPFLLSDSRPSVGRIEKRCIPILAHDHSSSILTRPLSYISLATGYTALAKLLLLSSTYLGVILSNPSIWFPNLYGSNACKR